MDSNYSSTKSMNLLRALSSHLNAKKKLEILDISDPSLFEQTLKKTLDKVPSVICIFTAKAISDDKSSKTWCPDCDRAKPYIDEFLYDNCRDG